MAQDLPIALRRCKRQRREVNYSESVKLPRAEAVKTKLYPVTVTERDSGSSRVKIHFVGYSEDYDEWREEEDLESLEDDQCLEPATPYQPFSVYGNLRVKIKQALVSGRKSSPIVKINIGFDFIQFNGGLKAAGRLFKVVQGVQHFKIEQYRDLDPYLGNNWHFRGFNPNGDYGYVQLETVDFCLRKSRCLVEYFPSNTNNEPPIQSSTNTGHVLSFCFVSNYGTATTFGKDKKIFFQ